MRREITWEPLGDSNWESSDGDRIRKVSPRGVLTLYALKRIGSRRPEWFDTLGEAKQAIAKPAPEGVK